MNEQPNDYSEEGENLEVYLTWREHEESLNELSRTYIKGMTVAGGIIIVLLILLGEAWGII